MPGRVCRSARSESRRRTACADASTPIHPIKANLDILGTFIPTGNAAVSLMPAPQPLECLPRTSASEVKKLGWRGVMKAVARHGKTVVTNHDEPEAVILPVEEYKALLERLREASARDEAALDTLRRRFDERLSDLQSPTAGDTLRTLLRTPLQLGGKLAAGEGH